MYTTRNSVVDHAAHKDVGSEHEIDPAERLRSDLPGALFRPNDIEEIGITRHQLPSLVRRGIVEHVARGLYRLADSDPSEHHSIAMACARVPNSIVCLLSALSVHELGTQLPREVWLAIPHKAEPPRVEGIKVRLIRFSGAAWSCGIRETGFEGVPARITSPTRTIVDCFRFERLIGLEAALEALHDALRQRIVSVDDLERTMEFLPSRRLRAAIKVLPYSGV